MEETLADISLLSKGDAALGNVLDVVSKHGNRSNILVLLSGKVPHAAHVFRPLRVQ